MKIKITKLKILAILALISLSGFPQSSYNGYKSSRSNTAMAGIVSTGNPFNVNLQVGAAAPFGLPANSSAVIPQVGLDFNFGSFGLRATGQFFKTSPEFDMGAYLAPISSSITQKGKDLNSNTMLGLSPYFNLSLPGFTLQPSLGIHYLMQKGADLMATYDGLPDGAVLDATSSTLDRSAVILSPNIRAMIGKPDKPIRFFAEAAYNMAVGIKEYKITSRNLEGVIRPDGSIDADLMEFAGTSTHIEKIIPGNFIIGVGVELNITASGNHNTSRSNRTPPINFGKDTINPGSCRCNLTTMTFDGNPVNDGGQIQVNIGYSGILNFSGTCSNNCNMKYYWEIFDPSGNSSGAIYNWNTSYQFTQSGTYTCTAIIDCGGTICQKSFFVEIKPGNAPCICECSIAEVKVGSTIVSNGQTLNFTYGMIPLKGTPISYQFNCSPNNQCEAEYSIEIIAPNTLRYTTSLNPAKYYFIDKGTYTCNVHLTCNGNNNCQDCSSSLTFYIKVSERPQRIELPFGTISQSGTKRGQAGEPVPGAELFLEQEPDEEPIMSSETGKKGTIIITNIQKPATYSLSLKFPLKNNKKITSSNSLIKHETGVITSSETDISSLKKINSYLINCPDGVFRLTLYGDPGINEKSEIKLTPKFDVTLSENSKEYEIKLLNIFLEANLTSVTSTVAFSFYALPKKPVNFDEDKMVLPNITNPWDIKQGSVFSTVNHYGIHDEGIK